jgi:hypothetical protein
VKIQPLNQKKTLKMHFKKKIHPWKMNPFNQKIKSGNAYPKEEFTLGKINH